MKKKESYKMRFKEGKPNEEMQKTPFSVPEDYFENLNLKIQNKVRNSEHNLPQEAGFVIPENYFDELPAAIYTRIAEERIRSAVKGEALEIPQGYFDDLSSRIQKRIQEESVGSPETKVLERPKKRVISIRKRLAYAAAACLIGMLSVMGYFKWSNSDILHVEGGQFLSEVSDEEIINYLVASSKGEDVFLLSEYFYPEIEEDENGVPSGLGRDLDEELLEDYLNYGL